ncbi:MAG TPA: alternative ribosome rescue aminoacyl-tRNA hydrolase ArfB [Salinimicrobium sp.]|nr:alternative ribosome rescue aminoacyl-tRNA hydrolase ArfB [Salinimicrobium sp.]
MASSGKCLIVDENQVLQELQFKAVRSSGAGGQNVNKVASKVELHFQVEDSEGLSDEEKDLIFKKLKSKITNANELIIQCDESRSQHQNKEIVIKRFFEILKESLKKPKPRKKTKPSKASKLKRLREKKINAEKKNNRKNPL